MSIVITTGVLMIISVFCFIPLIIAELAGEKTLPTAEDFFLHSGNMRSSFAFFSIFATSVGSLLFLIVPNSFAVKGSPYILASLLPLLLALLIVFFGENISGYGKRHGYLGMLDFFDDIYRSRMLNAVFFIVAMASCFMFLLLHLSAGGVIVMVASGGRLSWWVGMVLFASLIAISLWGHGIKNIIMMDLYYAGFVLLTLLSFVIISFVGVQNYSFTAAPIEMLMGKVKNLDFMEIIAMCVVVPLGMVMMPHMWLRYYSIEKPQMLGRHSWIVRLIAFCCVLVVIWIVILAVISCFSAEHTVKSFYMLPVLILNNFDAASATILICGIASAIFPVANAQLHAMIQMYVSAAHKNKLGVKFDDNWLKDTAKDCILTILAVAVLFSMIIKPEIFDLMAVAFGLFGQFAGAVCGALFWKRAGAEGAVSGMLDGIIVLLFLICGAKINPLTAGLFALVSNAIIFAMICQIAPVNKERKQRILIYMGENRSALGKR